jgi:hypothetical protein
MPGWMPGISTQKGEKTNCFTVEKEIESDIIILHGVIW